MRKPVSCRSSCCASGVYHLVKLHFHFFTLFLHICEEDFSHSSTTFSQFCLSFVDLFVYLFYFLFWLKRRDSKGIFKFRNKKDLSKNNEKRLITFGSISLELLSYGLSSSWESSSVLLTSVVDGFGSPWKRLPGSDLHLLRLFLRFFLSKT